MFYYKLVLFILFQRGTLIMIGIIIVVALFIMFCVGFVVVAWLDGAFGGGKWDREEYRQDREDLRLERYLMENKKEKPHLEINNNTLVNIDARTIKQKENNIIVNDDQEKMEIIKKDLLRAFNSFKEMLSSVGIRSRIKCPPDGIVTFYIIDENNGEDKFIKISRTNLVNFTDENGKILNKPIMVQRYFGDGDEDTSFHEFEGFLSYKIAGKILVFIEDAANIKLEVNGEGINL